MTSDFTSEPGEPTEPDELAEPASDDGPGLRASLEAILLVADEPVPEVLLAQVLERPRGEVEAGLRALAAEYTADGRGFDLREIAGGWRFYTREDCAPLVERFVRDGQEVRLTQAALETLAVIAYKQPVTVPEISEIRGVDSGGVIATLLDRKLITTAGRKAVIGRPILYKTTREFLMRFGLKDVQELPSMEEFEKLVAESFQSDLIPAPDATVDSSEASQPETDSADANGAQANDGTEAPQSAAGESAQDESEQDVETVHAHTGTPEE